MPEVPGDQFQTVMNRGTSDLQVGIRESLPGPLERGSQPPEHPGNGNIVWENRDRRQNPLFDVSEVAFGSPGAMSPREQFAHHYRAGELLLTWHAAEPLDVRRRRTASQRFRDRVSVEKVGHVTRRGCSVAILAGELFAHS